MPFETELFNVNMLKGRRKLQLCQEKARRASARHGFLSKTVEGD